MKLLGMGRARSNIYVVCTGRKGFAEIYRMMLTDRRFGLSVNLIATKVLPLLVPQMVNPQLQYEHFVVVHEVLQEMFDVIDK